MRRLILLTAILVAMCIATSQAVVIYDAPNGGSIYGWNWGTAICTSAAAEVDIGGGNIVIRHTGVVSNTTGAAADARYGSKWDFTVTGNTSADPADYTVSFDIRNVSGDWDPIDEGVAIVTPNPAVGTDQYGHGFPVVSVAQADGWVHVEFNLADFSNDWWQGPNWDLLQSTWSMEIGQPWPGTSFPDGTSFTQVWEVDNLQIVMGGTTEPHDPNETPLNLDESVGTPISQTQAQVTLGWNAGGDPNIVTDYPVNPAILGHYIYLSQGIPADDPNVYMIDYVAQVHNADSNLTDPYNEYGPITVDRGVTYYWQIEEALDDGTGNPYGDGDPNNIMGQLWSFDVIGAKPTILAGPENALADFSGNASFSVTADSAATDYRWFKVGTPDVQLSDGGIYSGTTTNTLVITGCTVADEGLYYCIAYNGDPEAGGLASNPSNSAILWYPRLVSYYPFETETAGVTPDIVSGFDAVLSQEAASAGLPTLNDANAIVGTYCLQLDNADYATDPNGQFATLPAGVVDYIDLTISAWIQPTSSVGWSRAFDFGNGQNDYLFVTPEAGNDWGVLRFASKVDNGDEQDLVGDGLTPGQWYHVAVTITGDTGRLYRNGQLVATNTGMTINPIDVGAVLNYLGKSQYPDPEFDGLIDDLKIYNYALSGYDVAQEYMTVAGGSVCDWEHYDQGNYDVNGNCIIDLPDFAAFAARWLEDDNFYPAP